MKFGVFYELQLPKPWGPHDERNLFHEALDQVALADRLGYDYAWEVEHHFLDEYSHSSAPEVFLAAAASRTKSIPLMFGMFQSTKAMSIFRGWNFARASAPSTASMKSNSARQVLRSPTGVCT